MGNAGVRRRGGSGRRTYDRAQRSGQPRGAGHVKRVGANMAWAGQVSSKHRARFRLSESFFFINRGRGRGAAGGMRQHYCKCTRSPCQSFTHASSSPDGRMIQPSNLSSEATRHASEHNLPGASSLFFSSPWNLLSAVLLIRFRLFSFPFATPVLVWLSPATAMRRGLGTCARYGWAPVLPVQFKSLPRPAQLCCVSMTWTYCLVPAS